MKKIMAVLLASAMVLAAAGCSDDKSGEGEAPVMISGQSENAGEDVQAGGAEEGGAPAASSDGYAFESGGVRVTLNAPAEDIIAALGDDYSYFEAQSCAFQGMDKVYTYSSFLVRTYETDGTDYILSVEFNDDTVTTPEGIFIGSSEEDVFAAYGETTPDEDGVLSYPAAGGTLEFIMVDGSVSAITYNAAV